MLKLNQDDNIVSIKDAVLCEVARLAFEGRLDEEKDTLPFEMIPGPKAMFRCCIYKEREIIRQRIRLAEGLTPGGDVHSQNVVQVISSACEECTLGHYQVTDNCRRCVSKKCQSACRFDAISLVQGTAKVDPDKCVGCTACVHVCPQELPVIVPYKGAKLVPCASKDDPETRKKLCWVSCIGCGDCAANCPDGLIHLEDGRAVIQPERCEDCNICSYVCPHAVIRPAVLNRSERQDAPAGMASKDMPKMPEYQFSITVSVMDCTGCGTCAACCPAKNKALVMEPTEKHTDMQKYFEYGRSLPEKEDLVEAFGPASVKGSQFKQPLLEFHGACAGCGETAYAKLATQLFGDRMYIANATGCSSIWGNSSPATPYTVNAKGRGPAWSNSLFEDAAEFGYGMLLSEESIRANLKRKVTELASNTKVEMIKDAADVWLSTYANGRENQKASEELIGRLMECDCALSSEILEKKAFLSKKSKWIFGGDGWAYDIGFGGLDHVLASGRDINILVFDTEVYSNTGGQASKSTPLGAVAQFAAGGKDIRKKDLAAMAMSYGYVFVAQVAMGADYNQCVRAFTEAEAYPGPSIILAYAPCINQGLKSGMQMAQEEEKLAVKAGYFHLFRYQPAIGEQKQATFHLDSREPDGDFFGFLNGEVRFNALTRSNPTRARELFERAKEDAKERYEKLKKMAR